jgi:hypothetical protein
MVRGAFAGCIRQVANIDPPGRVVMSACFGPNFRGVGAKGAREENFII